MTNSNPNARQVSLNRIVALKMTVRIFDSENPVLSTFVQAPISESILFSHIDKSGKLFAVLTDLENTSYWAFWDRKEELWEREFEVRLDGTISGMQWCLDPAQAILYRMRDPSFIQRWDINRRKEMQPLRLPVGSVEHVRVRTYRF